MIELVASLTILAIGIVALVNVMSSSFAVVASTGARTNGIALATKESEALRAIPYAQVGFEATQTGYQSSVGGETTVTLAANQSRVPAIANDVSVEGVTYRVARTIVWATATVNSTNYTGAYKKATIAVSWDDRSGHHTVGQTSLIYPGGLGPYNSANSAAPVACGTPSAPSALGASIPLTGSGAGQVVLAWTGLSLIVPNPPTDAISAVVVQSSPDNGTTWNTVSSNQPPSQPIIVPGLAAGTLYQFRVAAKNVCGNMSAWSPVASMTTAINLSTTCSYGTATVTPPAILQQAASQYLTTNAIVTVNTTGTNCSGLTVSYQTTAGASPTTVAMTHVGGVWKATVNGTLTAWSIGSHTITLKDGAGTTQGTLPLTVCSASAQACP